MKIGILTFVNTTNYGAALQAYALQSIFIEKGYDCEIIDYLCDSVIAGHDPKLAFRRKGIKILTAPIIYYIYKKRHERFKQFEKKYCKFSEPCTKENLSVRLKQYDKIVVGSDQIWNIDITGGDQSFFLDSLVNDTKKYSYAASVGKEYFSEDTASIYEYMISRFRNISVRENGTAKILIQKLKRNDISCDLDPTLLLQGQWEAFINSKVESVRDYIFMYLVPENEELLRYIRKFSTVHNCKIVWLKKGAGRKKGIKTVNIASPIDFLNYIAHAKYVVTGSFHALCFSIMFGVDFYITSSIQEERSCRLMNMLDIVGLSYRMLRAPSYTFDEQEIDFIAVQQKLSIMRERSMKTIEAIIYE